jgi:hypothetical protein
VTAPQLFETLDATRARDLTDQIKVGVEAVWHLITQAYQGRAWASLGYSSWDDYCTREFGTGRLRLPREDRQEVVASLRESGLSTRAIAAATGQSKDTVRRDLATGAHEPLGRVTGVNGKQYQPTRVEPDDEPEPLFAPGERDAILDVLHEEYGDDLDPEVIEQAVEDNVESKDPTPRPEWQPTKPDLGDGVSHPARYSSELIDLFRQLLAEYGLPGDNILDPFAGTGRIHDLQADGWETVGIELEPEWANLHPDTRIGDACALPFDSETFGAIVTSPTYGNRLADSHNASDPERRRSYTHDLGRPLSEENSGDLHWRTTPPGAGAMGSYDYRNFHAIAWAEAIRVLSPGGLFVLNCCDHVRDGMVQPVTAWHCWALGCLGLEYVESRSVETRKLRQGANGNLREQEQIHVFRKPL